MNSMLGRLLTMLQLTRVSIAFGAVSDLWFAVVLAWSIHVIPGMPDSRTWWTDESLGSLGVALGAALVTALGLFGCGAAFNDVLDARHDAAFRPGRPIPAGRIRPTQALVIAILALVCAVIGASILGVAFGGGPWSIWLTLLTASLLLFYNSAAKFVPAVGVVTIGVIHAVHMLIPSWTLPILLPVWWSMTHAMMVAATVHVLEEKRPVLTRQAWLGIAMGWIFWSVLLFLLVSGRGLEIWPGSLPWWGPIWPAMAMLLFVVFARWKIMTAPSLHSGAEKVKRYGAMWQALYGATWFLAIGLYTQAACFGVLACTGIIVMTILREVLGLSGRPLGYR
ncbi:MAG: UbiA family prenyltransferase [Planctomycetota bacterium]|nr:UbiA family prenyltransferase [Planctomycetota bacterium]